MAAKFSHDTVESALAEIEESNRQMMASERQCNCDYDSNMVSLGGRHSRVEQMFSAVSEHIDVVWAESSSLVAMNRDICTMVGNSMATFYGLWRSTIRSTEMLGRTLTSRTNRLGQLMNSVSWL